MKKIMDLILAAALFSTVLTACGKPAEQGQNKTRTTSTSDSAKNAGEYVTAAREESFNYEDSAGNSYSAVYKIPEINLKGSDALEVNLAITSEYSKNFTAAENEQNSRLSLTCDALDYEYFINGDILSVVIKRTYFSHVVDYSVYNFDIKTEQSLNGGNLAELLELDFGIVRENLKKALADDYNSKYSVESFPDDFYANYEKTMSDENVSASLFYLDGAGSLIAVCREYAGVGSGEFNVIINLT